MRIAAGLGTFGFTDAGPAAGTLVKAVHVNELRSALSAARSTIGLPALVYTDDPVAAGATVVKAQHIIEIRNGVK